MDHFAVIDDTFRKKRLLSLARGFIGLVFVILGMHIMRHKGSDKGFGSAIEMLIAVKEEM
jgi:hypothetical protein